MPSVENDPLGHSSFSAATRPGAFPREVILPRRSSRQPRAVVSIVTVLRGGSAGAGTFLSLIAVASPAGKQLTKHDRAAEP